MVHSLGEIQSFTAGKVWPQAAPSWWERGARASPLQEIGNPAINFKTQHTVISSSQALSPKIPTISQSSISSWGPSFQTHDSMGDILHPNHNREMKKRGHMIKDSKWVSIKWLTCLGRGCSFRVATTQICLLHTSPRPRRAHESGKAWCG